MTPKYGSWVPRCVKYEFDIFIMGGILRLYQTQGLYKICAPDTDVTEDSHGDCTLTAGHKNKQTKKQKKTKTKKQKNKQSFNLVKVQLLILIL